MFRPPCRIQGASTRMYRENSLMRHGQGNILRVLRGALPPYVGRVCSEAVIFMSGFPLSLVIPTAVRPTQEGGRSGEPVLSGAEGNPEDLSITMQFQALSQDCLSVFLHYPSHDGKLFTVAQYKKSHSLRLSVAMPKNLCICRFRHAAICAPTLSFFSWSVKFLLTVL